MGFQLQITITWNLSLALKSCCFMPLSPYAVRINIFAIQELVACITILVKDMNAFRGLLIKTKLYSTTSGQRHLKTYFSRWQISEAYCLSCVACLLWANLHVLGDTFWWYSIDPTKFTRFRSHLIFWWDLLFHSPFFFNGTGRICSEIQMQCFRINIKMQVSQEVTFSYMLPVSKTSL